MAKSVTIAVCPSCMKERELAEFRLGVIHVTMCPFCLSKYLIRCVIPNLVKSNLPTTEEKTVIDEALIYLKNEEVKELE